MSPTEKRPLKALPKELIEIISRDVIKTSENLDEAIESFKNFAQAIFKIQDKFT